MTAERLNLTSASLPAIEIVDVSMDHSHRTTTSTPRPGSGLDDQAEDDRRVESGRRSAAPGSMGSTTV